MPDIGKLKIARFAMFCIVGLASSLIDVGLLYVGVSILGMQLFAAATLSFAFASINAYIMNHFLTFKSGKLALSKYVQFLIVSIVGLCLTLILLHILTAYLLLHYIFAKIITIVLVVFWNYFANVCWTFRTKA